MKYIKILIIFLYLVCIVTKPVIATDTDILALQQEELNISEFMKETKKYTKDVLKDTDINDMFNSALVGKIDNKTLLSKILNIFGKEVKEAITILRKYISNNCNT